MTALPLCMSLQPLQRCDSYLSRKPLRISTASPLASVRSARRGAGLAETAHTSRGSKSRGISLQVHAIQQKRPLSSKQRWNALRSGLKKRSVELWQLVMALPFMVAAIQALHRLRHRLEPLFAIAAMLLEKCQLLLDKERYRYEDFTRDEFKRQWFWDASRGQEHALWGKVLDEGITVILTLAYIIMTPPDKYLGFVLPVGGALYVCGWNFWKSPVLWTWIVSTPVKYGGWANFYVRIANYPF